MEAGGIRVGSEHVFVSRRTVHCLLLAMRLLIFMRASVPRFPSTSAIRNFISNRKLTFTDEILTGLSTRFGLTVEWYYTVIFISFQVHTRIVKAAMTSSSVNSLLSCLIILFLADIQLLGEWSKSIGLYCEHNKTQHQRRLTFQQFCQSCCLSRPAGWIYTQQRH